jgi:hypothetical protein
MTRFLIYGDLTHRRMTDSTGAVLALPPLVLGDKCVFAIRLLDSSVTGSSTVIDLPVRSIKASIGLVDTPPASGTFTVKIGSGGGESASIEFNQDSATLMQAIQALPEVEAYGGVSKIVDAGTGCWLITFDHTEEVPLQVAHNRLSPTSFVRVRTYAENGIWIHELRLLQAPVASTIISERILAAAPSVRRIIAGCTSAEGLETILTNEVQAVTVSPGFTGTYALKFQGRLTSLLSASDDTSTIDAALEGLFTPAGSNFLVTNPEANNAYIEFAGPTLTGLPQELLGVVVGSAGIGDLTFTLDLNTAELATALRTSPTVASFIELQLEVGADGEDPVNPDPTVPGTIITLFREPVTLVPPLQWPEMATEAGIDWLLPPQPKDCIPFTRDQIITGSQYYLTSFGDGAAKSFLIAHNLGTDAIFPAVRENKTNGRLLIPGTDYTVVITDGNSIMLMLLAATAPAINSLALAIASAGPASAFQHHHHEIDEINGLRAEIDDLKSRVTTLEAILPTTGGASLPSATGNTIEIDLGAHSEIIFYRGTDAITTTGIDATKLPSRGPAMLPAIHGPDIEGLPIPLPDATVDTVWLADSRILIPGGYGVRSSYSIAGGYVGSNGLILFPVSEAGSTASYYPTPFERTLWAFDVNEEMLTVGKVLDAKFGVFLQLVNASCRAQWVLLIEHGVAQYQTDPAGTDPDNLSVVVWNPTPILSQRLTLAPVLQKHSFGCRIRRSVEGMSCDQMRYGNWSSGDSVPADANFVLRARLVEFDTENNTPNARGWVCYCLAAADATDSTSNAIATIS